MGVKYFERDLGPIATNKEAGKEPFSIICKVR